MKTRFFLYSAKLAVLSVIVVLASCPGSLDELEVDEQDRGVTYENYIKLTITPPPQIDQTVNNSRSFSADRAKSSVNFYELIVQKLGANPGDEGRYVSARGVKGGTLAVPVEKGAKYNVLLLSGYLPDGGTSPVLLQSGFAVSEVIQAGRNLVTMNMRAVEPDPETWESGTSQPRRNGEGLMVFNMPRGDDTGKWTANPAVRVRIKGLDPLITANGGVVNLSLFAEEPWINLAVYVPHPPALPRPWNHKRTGVDVSRAAGADPVTISWPITPQTDLPAGDYDALLTFGARYNGFSEKPAAGQPTGDFTPWRILNGLNNHELDFAGYPGGAVFVQIGQGSGKLPGNSGSSLVAGAGVVVKNVGAYSGSLIIEYVDGEQRTMRRSLTQNNGVWTYTGAGVRGKVIKSVIPGDPAKALPVGRLDMSGAITLHLDANGVPDLPLNTGSVITIGSSGELKLIAANSYGNTYKLEADLDLMGNIRTIGEWLPIGKTGPADDGSGSPFLGAFDGGGHTLSNLVITATGTGQAERLGLFSNVGNATTRAVIENLRVRGEINANERNVGGVAGWVENGAIRHCDNYVAFTVPAAGVEIETGGIIGAMMNGVVADCANYAAMSITNFDPNSCAAGIVSWITKGNVSISGCANYGAISTSSNSMGNTGGIVGYIDDGANVTITACANNAPIRGNSLAADDVVGGIVSGTYHAGLVSITACANKAGIFGNNPLHYSGILGLEDSSTVTITACYNTGSAGNGIIWSAGGSIITLSACYSTGTGLNSKIGTSTATSSDCFYTGSGSTNTSGGPGAFLQFSGGDWPGLTANSNDWGVFVGDPANPANVAAQTAQGNYWKSLGTPGTTNYPKLYWE